MSARLHLGINGSCGAVSRTIAAVDEIVGSIVWANRVSAFDAAEDFVSRRANSTRGGNHLSRATRTASLSSKSDSRASDATCGIRLVTANNLFFVRESVHLNDSNRPLARGTAVALPVYTEPRMHITATELTPDNVHLCYALWADQAAYEGRQFIEAMISARLLLGQERALGSITFDDDRPRAFCMTAFVDEIFVERYLREPYPQAGKDLLLHRCTGERRAILTRQEIGERNAGAGLQLVVLNSNVDETSPDLDSVLGLAMHSFQEVHRGYRTVHIINEAFGDYAIEVLITSGCYDVRRAFGWLPGTTIPSVLATLTREDAAARHNPLLPIFVYSPPRIFFTPSEQRLLRAALHGGTDEALSAPLGISLSSVKARWTRILQRAASRLPELFDTVPVPQRANRRGMQIRHLVLDYVRANPSELTPYARAVNGSARSGPLPAHSDGAWRREKSGRHLTLKNTPSFGRTK